MICHKNCYLYTKLNCRNDWIKAEYVIYIKNLKQSLIHWIVFRKVQRVIKFNQKSRLKPYIDMNTELRKKNKKWFWKTTFQVDEKFSFQRTMEHVQKHRDIKIVTAEKRETAWYQNQIIIPQIFSQNICWQ